MKDWPFMWFFIAGAGFVDLVGLFYLWRRRKSAMDSNHTTAASAARRKRITPAERRRRERRGTGQAASA